MPQYFVDSSISHGAFPGNPTTWDNSKLVRVRATYPLNSHCGPRLPAAEGTSSREGLRIRVLQQKRLEPWILADRIEAGVEAEMVDAGP